MRELRGQTVGFVGFGHIAEATAQICRAFRMKCIAVRRTAEPSPLLDAVYYLLQKLKGCVFWLILLAKLRGVRRTYL